MKQKTAILLAIMASALHAGKTEFFLKNNSTKIPIERKESVPQGLEAKPIVPGDLKIKNFYLNADPRKIKKIIIKDKEKKFAFDGFDGSNINKKPEIRAISTMDEIFVHPYFATTILLPAGSVITFARSSVPTEVFEYAQNTIVFQPKKKAVIGNITVFYSLDGKNRNMNIIVKQYGKEILKKNRINIVYSYRDIKKREPIEVINIYAKEYGKLPDKDYNFIYIDDILYRIVKDNKYGRVMFGGNKYRVETGVMYK